MKEVKVDLENCYGIKALTHTFDFTKCKAYSVYAPNGFMKTSFARTMADLSNGKESQDLIFPERISRRSVTDEQDRDIAPEQVLVIEPYNADFYSDKTSTLLVNQELKEQYDRALASIEEHGDVLFKKLKQLSGLTAKTSPPQIEMLKCFGAQSIYDLLEDLEATVESSENQQLSSLTYAEIFNEKTISFLESGEIRTQLKEYMERYDDLVENSPVLSKKFNHYHAKSVHRTLADNGFFTAKHSVNLFNGKEKEELDSADLLDERIEQEKKRILSDPALAKKFEAIDKKISNSDLRRFRDYLQSNPEIVSELADFKEFQRKLWIAYLGEAKEFYSSFLLDYKAAKEVIQRSVSTAKKEETQWREVVSTFNKRFTVPFQIDIINQADVILKGTSPQVSFTFVDEEQRGSVDRDDLLKVLSQGERRALYILNILFEITSRQKLGGTTLLIVDDIADSFDYKNKYAIVEYLREISRSPNFCSIFLTHNFDFHRTVALRLNIFRTHRLFAVKRERCLALTQEVYQKDPFAHWKSNLTIPKYTISAIPFVRNLADYCDKGGKDFSTLTCFLHLKPESKKLTVKDLQETFLSLLKDQKDLVLPEQNKLVLDLIFETADQILQENDQQAELESKIVLSIAIRLKAEEVMINRIANDDFVNSIKENQTITLLTKFREVFPQEATLIDILERVNLITPENIHLNSFMYEPILDMGTHHLKNMYREISEFH